MRPWPFVLAIAVLATYGCRGFGSEEEQAVAFSRIDSNGSVVLAPNEVEGLGLRTVEVRSGKIGTAHLRFGVVRARPDDDVQIIAPVDGRLLRVATSLGQHVALGDIVATVEPIAATSSQASLTSHRAEIHARIVGGRARIVAAKVELTRVSQLVGSGLATPSQRAQAKATLASERSLVEGLVRAERTLRGFAGGHIALAATADGVIAQLETRVGSFVSQGEMLARIVRRGPRWIDLAVPPDARTGDAYRVHVGRQEILARFLARGVVAHDAARIDRIEVHTEDPDALLPGTTVAVAVLHEVSGIVVPLQAVVRQGTERLCFVELHSGLYAPRRVDVAASNGTVVVASNGVSAGEHVVIQGAASLLGELGFSDRLAMPDLDQRRPPDGGANAR